MPERLNSTLVETLALPEKGSKIYYDDALPGFGIQVTSGGARTYLYQGRVNGKVVRYRLGSHLKLSSEEARKRAKKIAAEMVDGKNPNAAKKIAQSEIVTLAEALEAYIDKRQFVDKELKPSSAQDYRAVLNRCLGDWMTKPVKSLTRDLIENRYKKLSELKSKRGTGEAQAKKTMRYLKAVLEFARDKYRNAQNLPILTENPCRGLKQITKIKRRQSIILNHQLKDWYAAVDSLTYNNKLMRDYLLLCLFTGLRRNEAAKLRWDKVDLIGRTLAIPAEDSKNGQEHRLPMSDFVYWLLKARHSNRKLHNPYVFPAKNQLSTGHMVESKWSVTKVGQLCAAKWGVEEFKWMVHDLRRTFLTLAESLDIPHYALKKLVNHSTASDVTGGYLVVQVERLRKPMQIISDHLCLHCGIKGGDAPEEAVEA